MNIQIPSVLNKINNLLPGTVWENNLFLVGGSVRDLVLDKNSNPKDLDLVTEASAIDLVNFLHSQNILDDEPVIYGNFGTAMVYIDKTPIEVIQCRKESYRGNSRKPDVEPGTYVDDALRRDFTINTLRADLTTGEVIDTLGTTFDGLGSGLDGLKYKILVTPLPSEKTFEEDPLRMLRAVRFKNKYCLEYDNHLLVGLEASTSRLSIVSAERIKDELDKIISLNNCHQAFVEMNQTGMLDHLFDFKEKLDKNKSLSILEEVAKWSYIPETRWAAFWHTYPIEDLPRILAKAKFSNYEIGLIWSQVKHCNIFRSEMFSFANGKRLYLKFGENLSQFLLLCKTIKEVNDEKFDWRWVENSIEEAMRFSLEELRSPLSGIEVMKILNIPQGPEVGKAIDFLTEEVIEGRIKPLNKVEATQALQRFKDLQKV